jgi:two-component system NtrC family sensor kinase
LIIESKQKEEEAKVLQEQLRHADRLATIGNLAAGVAHELNEPLASILGRAQLIEKMDGVPAAVLADNAKIVTASLHAREIISKLRLFARQKSPRKERVNLNHIVRDGLFLVERRCEESGVALVQRLAPELPTIVADPDQLYQVLVNLVVNAVQATASGGRITIETLAADDGVVLAVEDNGCGMDEDVLKQAFTPFFTTKESEGTGLGLAVVHGIVTSHGGTIGVESRYGHGSRFEVRLPFENPTTERSR